MKQKSDRIVRALVLGFVVMLIAAQMVPAAPALSDEEIAAACIGEITEVQLAADEAMVLEQIAFQGVVQQATFLTPVSQLFKAGSQSSGRMDKISDAAVSRIDKILNRCTTRIERIHGDEAWIKEVAAAAQTKQGLINESRLNRHLAITDLIRMFITNLT